MRRVVITGLGAISPIGNNVEENWKSIKEGKCGIDYISHFDTSNIKVKVAGEVKGIDFQDYFDQKDARRSDRFNLLGRLAAREAVLDSKLDMDKIDHDRFGVIFASGIGGMKTFAENEDIAKEKGASRVSPFFIPTTLINLCAGQIAIEHKAYGYCTSVVTACASGTNAIGDAFHRIKFGMEDIIIAGGSEASVCELGIAGFQVMKALYTGDNPNRASIPFDSERAGFVMGEGGAALILEELEHAKARGAHIYAEIVGYGCSCDAHHITAPLETGIGAAKAINNAIKDANISIDDIDYINAHGTSTHLNDLTETNAVKLVFGNDTKVMMSSTKGNTGHLLGAAGAIEAIYTAKALEDSFIPPTINYECKDEECNLDIVPNVGRNIDIKYAMSNSLGFGGHNASIILKKWSE